jgi:hypothetical protein
MGQEHLSEALVSRMEELGVPPMLIERVDFQDKFLAQGWVMVVRNRDNFIDIRLFHPQQIMNFFPRRIDRGE